MGGTIAHPSYELVCTGSTGHTETVQVEFDSSKISYSRLLKEFWEMHDPTTMDRQGNDIGSQYRSAIFTTTDEQVKEVQKSRLIYQAELDTSSIGKIVTQILPADGHTYYEAEAYHQRYLEKNPNGYDCHSSTGTAFPQGVII
jgi:peptide-methionine (S)-S-oxide reductase